LLSWIARQLRATLHIIREWSSRHVFGITITLLIIAFLALFFWERILVSIHAGQVGVLWRRFGGTVVHRVYGEGLHFILPFNIMYVYDVRWNIVRRSITTLTQDGLDMTVTLAVLYRVNPPLAGELHQRVGMGYVDTLITPTMASIVRNVLGRLNAEALFVDRPETMYPTPAGVVDFVERDLIEQLKEQVQIGWHYIEVADVNVERLIMPETVQAAIQRRREEQQRIFEYDYQIEIARREAERKRIEAGGIEAFQAAITGGLSPGFLTFKRIEAILELAKSANAKVIVLGEKGDLPLFLGPVPLGQDGQLPPK
jgi:regulator of protease activity HflC (stomatin/prohibitin superfamily)